MAGRSCENCKHLTIETIAAPSAMGIKVLALPDTLQRVCHAPPADNPYPGAVWTRKLEPHVVVCEQHEFIQEK